MQSLQQICLLASQKAKGGGTTFGSGMTPTAGQMLNGVLEELKLVRNLKMNRVTQPITFPAGTNGPFALEADYLRTYDMFYPLPTSGGGTSQGLPQFLRPLTMEQFDAEFKDPSMANYPYFWATDLSTQVQVWSPGPVGVGTMTSAGQLFIYPQSSGVLVITHRYMKNQPDYVTPELSANFAWFPHSLYLITRTAAEMCDITGDDRKAQWMAESEKMLHPFLIMEGDEQSAVHQIKLDPRAFHFAGTVKPTKSYPFP
jgi:hypothetical protein